MTLNDKQEKLCTDSKWNFSDLNALFLNCTLKKTPQLSHTQGLIDISKAIMEKKRHHRRSGASGRLHHCVWRVSRHDATRMGPRRLAADFRESQSRTYLGHYLTDLVGRKNRRCVRKSSNACIQHPAI